MAGKMWMMERAMEELESLEARHPARFDYLKLELRSLIADCDLHPSPPHRSSSFGTQASSNRKRRGSGLGFGLEKRRKTELAPDDRAEMAIERAKDCLRRIRVVKESFLR